jgi:hypothetical protein
MEPDTQTEAKRLTALWKDPQALPWLTFTETDEHLGSQPSLVLAIYVNLQNSRGLPKGRSRKDFVAVVRGAQNRFRQGRIAGTALRPVCI